jgi:hypothetical protein
LRWARKTKNERHWETPTGLAGAEQRPTQEEETPMGTRDLLVGQIGRRCTIQEITIAIGLDGNFARVGFTAWR